MKAIMFDSLNRRLLEPYGGDWVRTPNFQRLAAGGKAVPKWGYIPGLRTG